jgi:hypothetical protein
LIMEQGHLLGADDKVDFNMFLYLS